MITMGKQRYIMVVEDSPEDFDVLERGFKKAEILIPLLHFHSSMEALNTLLAFTGRSPESVAKAQQHHQYQQHQQHPTPHEAAGDDEMTALLYSPHTRPIAHEQSMDIGPKPSLIMMDLNMPGLDGFDMLERLKSDPDLCRIPVLVLSTSKSEIDIDKSYAAGANAFVSKPVDIAGYVRMAGIVKTFWFECAMLPAG